MSYYIPNDHFLLSPRWPLWRGSTVFRSTVHGFCWVANLGEEIWVAENKEKSLTLARFELTTCVSDHRCSNQRSYELSWEQVACICVFKSWQWVRASVFQSEDQWFKFWSIYHLVSLETFLHIVFLGHLYVNPVNHQGILTNCWGSGG